MANYCSNHIHIIGATLEASTLFREHIEDDGIETPTQWLVNLDTNEYGIIDTIICHTKWVLHKESIEFILEVLKATYVEAYYEEPGNLLAGKLTTLSNGNIQNDHVIPEYWDDSEKVFETDNELPKIEDYLTTKRCLLTRFNNLINSLYSIENKRLFRLLIEAHYRLSQKYY